MTKKKNPQPEILDPEIGPDSPQLDESQDLKNSDPPQSQKSTIQIMNVGKHAFWTKTRRVDPGEIVECDIDTGDALIARGAAELFRQ